MLIAPIASKPYNIICGVDEAIDYPYLFLIPSIQDQSLNSTYCVDKCTVKGELFSVYKYGFLSTLPNVFYNTTNFGYICLPSE